MRSRSVDFSHVFQSLAGSQEVPAEGIEIVISLQLALELYVLDSFAITDFYSFQLFKFILI